MKQGVLTPGRVRLLLHRGITFLQFFSRVFINYMYYKPICVGDDGLGPWRVLLL